ncbi:MAG: cytochrome b/b6 domain-containing protein [Myxococcus sp.]|nr:cytochrome b/b6 domain-containing protein [Myxococcus sp.]
MKERWSTPLIALHWLSAALLVGLVVVGFVMVDLPADTALRRGLGRAHSLTGVALGLLTLVRLVVRLRGPSPAPLPLAPLHRRGASFIQGLLYVGLFGMAATGVATAYRSNWHGYLEGAEPSPVFDGLRSRQVHEGLVAGLLVLVGAHVIGALVQQLRKGGTLRRIWPSLDASRLPPAVQPKEQVK